MADYYTQSMRALQLAGMSERTQECYTRAVRQLAQFYGKAPAQISETELEDYFLHRQSVTGWSAATLRIAQAGIKFFFVHVLHRDWHLFEFLAYSEQAGRSFRPWRPGAGAKRRWVQES